MSKNLDDKIRLYGTAEKLINEEQGSFSYKLTLNSKHLMEDFIDNSVARLSIVDLHRPDNKLSVINNNYPDPTSQHFSHVNIMLFGDNLLDYFIEKGLSKENTKPINFFLSPVTGDKEKLFASLYDYENKKSFGCGMAWRNEHINLGKSTYNDKYNSTTVVVNKKELFGYIKSHFSNNKNVFLKIFEPNKSGTSSVTISNSLDITDRTKLIVKLSKDKLLSLPTFNDNIRFFISPYKDINKSFDKYSDFYVYSLINNEKNYIGKAWSKDNFLDYVNSLKSTEQSKDKVKENDHNFSIGDFVSFDIDNDYFLNEKYGKEKGHEVIGVVKEVKSDKYLVSVAGSNAAILCDPSMLKSSTEENFKNFEVAYNKIKNEITERNVENIKKKDANSRTKSNSKSASKKASTSKSKKSGENKQLDNSQENHSNLEL